MTNILLCPGVEQERQEKTQCIVPHVSGEAFTFSPVKCDDGCGTFFEDSFFTKLMKFPSDSNLLIL